METHFNPTWLHARSAYWYGILDWVELIQENIGGFEFVSRLEGFQLERKKNHNIAMH